MTWWRSWLTAMRRASHYFRHRSLLSVIQELDYELQLLADAHRGEPLWSAYNAAQLDCQQLRSQLGERIRVALRNAYYKRDSETV